MKLFHTADWHLGKLVQGIYMTEDQKYVLDLFIEAIKNEEPDVVIIAGDLYDRAVPPTEAVQLLNNVLDTIVLELHIPVLAVGGNHDSPSRLHFGSKLMKDQGLHIVGQLQKESEPVILTDQYGEVHFHLIPYCDPSVVRYVFEDESITTFDLAMEKITQSLLEKMNPHARHVFIGHAFVTKSGEEEENTSESERPLSIGGAEYVNSHHFNSFHYTALGHLHQAHYVRNEHIRYAGSPLKYSLSEEHHNKGYYIVDLGEKGVSSIEKREFIPKRDLRSVEGTMDEILQQPKSEDYVFVRLLDETPVLSPMEKLRSVYPNCMHVERKVDQLLKKDINVVTGDQKSLTELELFRAFYKEVTGEEITEDTEKVLTTMLDEFQKIENETVQTELPI